MKTKATAVLELCMICSRSIEYPNQAKTYRPGDKLVFNRDVHAELTDHGEHLSMNLHVAILENYSCYNLPRFDVPQPHFPIISFTCNTLAVRRQCTLTAPTAVRPSTFFPTHTQEVYGRLCKDFPYARAAFLSHAAFCSAHLLTEVQASSTDHRSITYRHEGVTRASSDTSQ
ncbi:uncharacterized protein EDB91DRAFT_580562 [Suillus paluster]|uniref:uncharacterized protein n=1 Tax=Suillus paluster TaxID=48578 RepID=UPI001B87F824|nr:uncharacterized protein EDB91DRAFT_580562 [Suillus paluster]KAG1718572.1 hypothetical protein EDB91DRAFT_580562 [Suillus paluster]